MERAFFADVSQSEYELQGFRGKLPVFYRDTAWLSGLFTASTSRVAPLLPHPDLHPVELRPGRCLVDVSAFEHRDSDIGPYDEVSVGVLVAFGRRPLPFVEAVVEAVRRSFAVYVLHLPVTTEPARLGGVELYGLPKFMADIGFTRDDRRVVCTLAERGDPILTLSAAVLPGHGHERTHVTLYSMKDGRPTGAEFEMNHRAHAQTMRRGGATLELGTSHPMARAMATWGLGPAPVLVQQSTSLQGILYGPHAAEVKLAHAGT